MIETTALNGWNAKNEKKGRKQCVHITCSKCIIEVTAGTHTTPKMPLNNGVIGNRFLKDL